LTPGGLEPEKVGMRYTNSIGWIVADGPGSGALEVQVDWEDAEAVVRLEVPGAAQAAPAIAHGGFLAALADHVMGRVDQSGLVTFRGRGDFARVSPARRHPGTAEIDYDTLEERFDPSQVFGWLAGALKNAYVPRATGSPLVVSVEVSDAEPRHWTVSAAGASLAVEPGEPADWDVRFVGTVRAWRELVYRRKTASELMAAGSAAVEDPGGLLASFLGSLAT
jgi:hypothetical protein